MKTSSMILSCLFIFGACSKMKELDKRTEKMEKSTEKVSSVTDDLKDTTTSMYQQLRSKEAEATREQKFQILLEDEADMGIRMTEAAVFFKSFEFQLWNNNGTFDNQQTLNSLYTDAANEFTRRMIDLYAKVDTQKMSPTKKNKMEMSFYAISATMHMNNGFQEDMMKKRNLEPVSFFDLMKKALRKDKNYKKLSEHEEILVNGENKEIMIELIKARVDILAALALKNLTASNDMTLGQKAKALLFKMTGGKYGEIELPETYEKSNATSKEFVTRYLEASVKAQQFLREIGVEKKLEKTLNSAFNGIDFNEKNSTESLNKKPDPKKDSIRLIINELLG